MTVLIPPLLDLPFAGFSSRSPQVRLATISLFLFPFLHPSDPLLASDLFWKNHIDPKISSVKLPALILRAVFQFFAGCLEMP